MGRGKSSNEFYIAFFSGLKPEDLIKRGFNKFNVYNYYRRYNKVVKPNYELLLRMPLVDKKEITEGE